MDEVCVLEPDDERVATSHWDVAIVGEAVAARLDAEVIIALPFLDDGDPRSATVVVRGGRPEPMTIESLAQLQDLVERFLHVS